MLLGWPSCPCIASSIAERSQPSGDAVCRRDPQIPLGQEWGAGGSFPSLPLRAPWHGAGFQGLPGVEPQPWEARTGAGGAQGTQSLHGTWGPRLEAPCPRRSRGPALAHSVRGPGHPRWGGVIWKWGPPPAVACSPSLPGPLAKETPSKARARALAGFISACPGSPACHRVRSGQRRRWPGLRAAALLPPRAGLSQAPPAGGSPPRTPAPALGLLLLLAPPRPCGRKEQARSSSRTGNAPVYLDFNFFLFFFFCIALRSTSVPSRSLESSNVQVSWRLKSLWAALAGRARDPGPHIRGSWLRAGADGAPRGAPEVRARQRAESPRPIPSAAGRGAARLSGEHRRPRGPVCSRVQSPEPAWPSFPSGAARAGGPACAP